MEDTASPIAPRRATSRAASHELGIHPEPPAWINSLLEEGELRWHETANGHQIRSLTGPQATLVSIRVPDAVSLKVDEFQAATRASYQDLLESLAGQGHIARLWNSIPNILEPLGDLPHRYMAFNAGRYDALAGWYETHESFPTTLATASGTGHFGTELVLHGLATPYEGQPLENPRQIPSYRYSFRYGPRPPCFARATHLNINGAGPGWLLVGGTASIVGEDCTYDDDLDGQMSETAQNLEALVRSAYESFFSDSHEAKRGKEADRLEILSRFRHLRVYYTQADARDEIKRLVEQYFPHLEQLELHHSVLCRPELLIEIEGLAELPRSKC